MRIKKGDNVKMLAGKDRSKTGKVIRVDQSAGRITVEGLNVWKKHARPRREGEKGEIVSVTRPVRASKVALVCPSCKKATRIGMRIDGDKKERVCKKCGATI
ncbi:50S ribosomal protein L24 [Patescibacteria group bacterium]|nr:50S ribosomal protein L24 [Patescibacteria group bacterium]